jgi:hypothetical protein
MTKSYPPKKTASSKNDDDAGLYARAISIKVLVTVGLGIAAVVASVGLYLGNQAIPTTGRLTPPWVWAIRVLVLAVALAGGWQVKRHRRRRAKGPDG